MLVLRCGLVLVLVCKLGSVVVLGPVLGLRFRLVLGLRSVVGSGAG